ncbi:hypothetical protein GOV13_02880, partial [Candidatus Pacearchaeota archaeon]|nr:hypothetical protein [Candidatus Pacearchaeota archaeon]
DLDLVRKGESGLPNIAMKPGGKQDRGPFMEIDTDFENENYLFKIYPLSK